jgi:sugar lactone lactonase YvrE
MVEDGSLTEYVKEYEGRPFIGPSALAFDFKGNLYIADSGPLGTSGIGRCTGALYMVSADDQILHPIIANGLAQPSGLAVHIHGDTPIIYVSEFSANRILKVVKTDAGSFHASVWVQLQGRSGVSSVTCDARGNVYAARFEFASLAKDGEVVVYSPLGVELRRIVVPGLPEITGLCFSENDGVLYVTEGSHNVVFKISM